MVAERWGGRAVRVVCAHPAATEKAVLNALAERTALLTDAVGGLSTLVTDRVLVREGQRVAAELALLQKRQQVRWCWHYQLRLPTRRVWCSAFGSRSPLRA